MNHRLIVIEVMRYEDDPDRPAKNHSVSLELNRVLFLADTMETGFACTVLEENTIINFTEIQCRFAKNENTMNVSKFVASVKFTDTGEMGGIVPVPIQVSALVSFNKTHLNSTEGK